MSDFVRPAVRAGLWRWRESLSGLAVIGIGLWWLATFFQPVQWLGWAFAALGLAIALGGAQKARFRRGVDGPGTVLIDERRLSYFGPLTGGILDLDDATRLELEPVAHPAPHWVLSGVGGQGLAIPVNADGADALFDLFASLPGLRTSALLDALEKPPKTRVTIWERPPVRLS